jgi:hypothetical protein
MLMVPRELRAGRAVGRRSCGVATATATCRAGSFVAGGAAVARPLLRGTDHELGVEQVAAPVRSVRVGSAVSAGGVGW